MQTTIAPMSLGDMFDRLFKLIGKTAVRNLIIAVIILVPASIFFAYGMNDFFSFIAKAVKAEELNHEFPREYFVTMFRGMTFFFAAYTIFILAYLAATVGVTIVGCAEMSNQQLSWSDALSQTFSIRLLRVYGQQILEYLMLGCMFFIPVIFLGIGAGAESIGIILLGVMLVLIAGVFAVYLFIRWAFALPAIAWEDSGVIQSFGRSSFLVKGFWWRTFGIILLLTIIAQFAISIITTPIEFIALWGFFSKYFSMIGSIAEGTVDSYEILDLFDSIGGGLGIVIFVSYVLMLLITPLITVVIYFDLRARKNEFVQPTELVESK
jgi:hypothetical protein